jgi:hypothetical protein
MLLFEMNFYMIIFKCHFEKNLHNPFCVIPGIKIIPLQRVKRKKKGYSDKKRLFKTIFLLKLELIRIQM